MAENVNSLGLDKKPVTDLNYIKDYLRKKDRQGKSGGQGRLL
jgi:hypothetical protein